MFPSLSILDTLDKIGKDAFNNASMVEAASRIPDNLFDKSPITIPAPINRPIHEKEKKKLKTALARTHSLQKIPSKNKVNAKTVVPKATSSKLTKAKSYMGPGKTRSSRSGLVFPVGRIKRKLREVMIGQRVGVGSAIYMGATLEYLSA